MAFATLYSGARVAGLTLCLGFGFQGHALAVEGTGSPGALRVYEQARKEHAGDAKDIAAAWKFGRACFDLAEFATNKTERADIAQQGVNACNAAIASNTNSVQAHYYLALNLGQLARTRGLGALRLVSQMEREFLRARELDNTFDYSGPDRSLGLLYMNAPTFGSIGSRTKARQHFQNAIQLAPRFPENRIVYIEAQVKWNERNAARHDLKEYEEIAPALRKELAGPTWTVQWTDWDARLDTLGKDLEKQSRALETPREKQ